VRNCVVNDAGSVDEMGSMGLLEIQVTSAQNLIKADVLGLSDPYVCVGLGLQSTRTIAIKKNLNPVWNKTLTLPVNEDHLHKDVILSVWDEDTKAVQGEDDFLGSLHIPMNHVYSERRLDKCEKLQEVKHGELSFSLSFRPIRNISSRSLSTKVRCSLFSCLGKCTTSAS